MDRRGTSGNSTERINGETTQDMDFSLMPKQGVLPFWPDDMRGLPAAALRSALFAPVKRGARAHAERLEIKSVGDFKIIFTGHLLDQADLDVYKQTLHLARKQPLGNATLFKARDFLRSIGRDTGSSQRDWLLRSITRLAAGLVEISKGHLSYSGSLIDDIGRDTRLHYYYVTLNPRIADLFAQGWSTINPVQRKALGNAQLAKWLHAFTSGQEKPLTFRLDKLAEYANSRRKRKRDFRAHLDDACEQVRAAGRPLLLKWSTDKEKVTITRDAWVSRSQLPEPADA